MSGEAQLTLVLQNGRFNFSKNRGDRSFAACYFTYERVEYQYRADEKKLYRLKYRNLHQTGNESA